MRIGVYEGKTDAINIDGITFDKNTPTYIAPYMSEIIFKRDDFTLYNEKNEYPGQKRHIYVNMPSDFRLFVGAINVLKRIKQCFPLCPIIVTCNSEWVDIIGDLATCNNSYGSELKKDQYREFNLHISEDQIPYHLNRWKNFSIEQILLEKIQLWETNIDMHAKPKHLGINKSRDEVIVFHSGDNPDNTWQELSDALDNSSYVHFEKAKYNRESITNYLELFGTAKYIIVCGDAKISFLAAFSGAPSLCITQNDTWDKDKRLKQLGARGGIFNSLPNVQTVLDAIDKNISTSEKKKSVIEIKPPPIKKYSGEEFNVGDIIKNDSPKKKKKKKK